MKKIVIMPGGFHPFHRGHTALYNSVKEAFPDADVYVVASDDQKARPFPFKVKQKLAKIAGVPSGEFVQVKQPFRPDEVTSKYNAEEDVLIFVRSDKDKDESPVPGTTKRDGSPSYYQLYEPHNLKPFDQNAYFAYFPTVEFADGITSGSEIRNTWPKLDSAGKAKLALSLYPNIANNAKLIKNVIGLFDSVLQQLAEGDVFPFKRPDLPTNIENLIVDWFNDRNKYTKAQLQAKGYKVRVDSQSNNIIVVDKKGTKYKVSVDDAMDRLIQHAYKEPLDESIDKNAMMSHHEIAELIWRRTDNVELAKEFLFLEDDLLSQNDINSTAITDIGEDPYNYDLYTVNEWLENNHMPFFVKRMEQDDSYNTYYEVDADMINEEFVDPDTNSKQYWNHDAQMVGVGGEIEMPLRDTDRNGRRGGFNESIAKIRSMIKETTDDQKAKSIDLHHKLFKLFEEDRDNVIRLKGFRKEKDDKVVDMGAARDRKAKEQESKQNRYNERRYEQEELLARLQAELLNALTEFEELEQAGLLPIEMKDAFDTTRNLIDYIATYNPDDEDFPFTEDLVERLQLKTVQLKEYFGGWRDTSAPRVLRKQQPTQQPGEFWNKIDLSETDDYIEEK